MNKDLQSYLDWCRKEDDAMRVYRTVHFGKESHVILLLKKGSSECLNDFTFLLVADFGPVCPADARHQTETWPVSDREAALQAFSDASKIAYHFYKT